MRRAGNGDGGFLAVHEKVCGFRGIMWKAKEITKGMLKNYKESWAA